MHAKEMTLDSSVSHADEPRVTSLNSWYLTSLINLSFYNLRLRLMIMAIDFGTIDKCVKIGEI